MSTGTTTIDTITDEQIKVLRTEAGAAGDKALMRRCCAALAPGWCREEAKREARLACVEAIREAELA